MRLTLRVKLFAIVGSTALAFLVVIVASTLLTSRTEKQLATIREQHIPRLELGPSLESDFEALRRGLQDAVAARDTDALDRTRALEERLLGRLGAAHDLVDPGDARALREAVAAYYAAAYDVSRRMIAGETGEGLVGAIESMQAKLARAEHALAKVTAFDRRELPAAFAAASEAQTQGARIRLTVLLGSLGLVLAMSLLMSRSVLRSLAALEAGFARFGAGNFAEPIRLAGRDELVGVAEKANRMAERLAAGSEERDRADWLKAGLMGLTEQLRGELEPDLVALNATRHLARYLDAPAAALYAADAQQMLRLLAHHAGAHGAGATEAFRPGEGLVGQAATAQDILVVEDPPDDYLRVRSGLGEGAPRSIVLVPLVRDGDVTGVLELAFFKQVSDTAKELLLSARGSIAIALEVAHARAATRELLARTQEQAARLTAQEEELRAANEGLQEQQEELRQTNEELAQQAEELEVQRRTLQESNSELQAAQRRLELQAQELIKVSTYKSQFLANMSHELRTPLNSMLLLSNLLAENAGGNLTAKQVEYCNTVHSAGKDLLALINQVLDLAKVEAGKQEVRIEQVELESLADHARRVFTPLARDKGLRFEVTLTEGLPEAIRTDRQRLSQILTNLLGNAIKFTASGEVVLHIGRPDAGVRFAREDLAPESALAFRVRDTGVGIAPEHRERIFAPFEQVEAAADRRYGGTGLGLSIAREFSALLGGEIQLETALGKGSTFACYIPIDGRSASARPRTGPPAAPQRAERARPEAEELHLLIIEDDPVFADVLGRLIEERGLKHAVAGTGEAGLELARRRRPCGIILDVALPGVDGWKIMEELRSDPATAGIPVHFVSAVDLSERGLALGAVGYLTKPATRQDLVGVLEALVPPKTRGPCRVLVVEDDRQLGDSLLGRLASEGLEARRVTTARDALQLLKNERFACMILDLSLPDMDGLALLEVLRRGGAADIPAVVVHTDRALSKAEASQLEAYAEAIVLADGSSSERLVDEVRLFVRRLQEGLAPRRRAKAAPPPDVRLAGRKLLVADDDMRTVYALSAMLRAKGADVLVADTGAAALSVLSEHPDVEAVLMDVMMPEMDGYEATRRIRQDPRFRRLPIIALTAKAMKGDREKCIESGATDYLSKPIEPDSLLTMIQARLPPGDNHG